LLADGGLSLVSFGTKSSGGGNVGASSRIRGGDETLFDEPARGEALPAGAGKRGPAAWGGRAGAFGITTVRSDEGSRCAFGTRSTSGRVARVSSAGLPAAGRTRCASDVAVGFAFGSARSLSKIGRDITLVASSSGFDSSASGLEVGAGRAGGGAAAGARGAVGARVAIGRMTGAFAPPIGRSCGRFGCGGGPGAGRAGGGGRPEPAPPPAFFDVIDPGW